MKERDFQVAVEDLCKWRHLRYYHTWNSRHSAPGFPDLVIVGRRTIFAELKTEKGKVSAHQQAWVEALRFSGETVYLWRPSDMPEIQRVLADLS